MLTLDDIAFRRIDPRKPFHMTRHARFRTSERRFGVAAVEATLTYGRVVHVRGAEIHAIGRKEVLRFRRRGIDLRAFEGMQVVCAAGTDCILTAYRNRDFRTLRTRRHGWRKRPPCPSQGIAVP